MIKEVKLFRCEYNTDPDDEDLAKAIEIAKENHCFVKIEWTMKWSGSYSLVADEDDTIEDLKRHIPKIYGM